MIKIMLKICYDAKYITIIFYRENDENFTFLYIIIYIGRYILYENKY